MTTVKAYVQLPDAVAPCFIEDILHLRHDKKDDVWWINKVPAVSFLIIGMVVGVAEYESRSLFTVDDGSAVIDCVQQRVLAPSDHSKTLPQASIYLEQYKPRVGSLVRAIGKVVARKDDRLLKLDRIEPLQSAVDEPKHWLSVLDLHQTKYSKDFSLPQFIPPPVSVTPGPQSVTALPTIQPVVAGEPILNSPPKLRHPSKLTSRDVNETTFRLYLKHFMDNSAYLAAHAITQQDQFGDAALLPLRHGPRGSSDKFTLTYLYRVPELRGLAHRIVIENNRRAKRAIDRATSSSEAGSSKHPKAAPAEDSKSLVKSIFVRALRELVTDGDIVIVTGPGRVWTSIENDAGRKIWKDEKPRSTNGTSERDLASSSADLSGDDDAQSLSSGIDEDCYTPVTSSLLCVPILRVLSNSAAAPMGVKDIQRRLSRDSRWENVGEQYMRESLDLLQTQKRIKAVRQGAWVSL